MQWSSAAPNAPSGEQGGRRRDAPTKPTSPHRGGGLFGVFSALLLAIIGAVLAAQFFLEWRKQADPRDLAREMMPVLVDLAALERAERCLDLTNARTEFLAGMPYNIKTKYSNINKCSVESEGAPKATSFGGFPLPSYEDCDELKAEFPKSVERHENNLKVKAKLACDSNGKPTLEPDDSVRLSAQTALRAKLPSVARAVASGEISPEIEKCYNHVKEQLAATAEEERQLRCKIMTADFEVANITFDAIWTRARLHDELEAYRREHEIAWEAAQKADKVSFFYDLFTDDAKRKACQGGDTSFSSQRAAALAAAATCL